MIRAVICDFGGVLTTPLIESFLAYQRECGISIEDLGVAMGEDDAGGRRPSPAVRAREGGDDARTSSRAGSSAALGREVDSMRDTYFSTSTRTGR